MPRVGFKPVVPELQDRAAIAMAPFSFSTHTLLLGKLISPSLIHAKFYLKQDTSKYVYRPISVHDNANKITITKKLVQFKFNE
jgi:hypothetical protein